MLGRIASLIQFFDIIILIGFYTIFFSDFIGSEKLMAELNDNWNDIAPNLFMYNFSVSSENEKSKVSSALREFYFGGQPISKNTIPELVQVAITILHYSLAEYNF